jgi:hypothetical protein
MNGLSTRLETACRSLLLPRTRSHQRSILSWRRGFCSSVSRDRKQQFVTKLSGGDTPELLSGALHDFYRRVRNGSGHRLEPLLPWRL